MAVTEIPTKYSASDGREFNTQDEAERHEQFIVAQKEYETARNRFGRLLAETQLTADGKPFRFDAFKRYWHVTAGWSGMPALSEVRFDGWNYQFDVSDRFVIRQDEGRDGNQRWVEYRIDVLYANYPKAERALLAAQEKWLAVHAEKVDELRAALGKATA